MFDNTISIALAYRKRPKTCQMTQKFSIAAKCIQLPSTIWISIFGFVSQVHKNTSHQTSKFKSELKVWSDQVWYYSWVMILFLFFLQFLQIAWIRDFFPTQFYILSKVELALKGVNFTVIRKKTSGSTTAIRDHQESRGIRKSYYIVLKYLGVCWPKITIQTGYWIKNSKHRQLQHVFYKFPAEISNICVEFNKTLNFLQTSLNFLLFISGFQG